MGQIVAGNMSGGGGGLSKLLSLVKLGTGIVSGDPFQIAGGAMEATSKSQNPSTPQVPNQAPSGGDAMNRALQSQQQTPAFQVKNGMDLVMNHPVSELGISPELHAQLFETFARAHHFGYGGGLDESGNEQMDNGGYA